MSHPPSPRPPPRPTSFLTVPPGRSAVTPRRAFRHLPPDAREEAAGPRPVAVRLPDVRPASVPRGKDPAAFPAAPRPVHAPWPSTTAAGTRRSDGGPGTVQPRSPRPAGRPPAWSVYLRGRPADDTPSVADAPRGRDRPPGPRCRRVPDRLPRPGVGRLDPGPAGGWRLLLAAGHGTGAARGPGRGCRPGGCRRSRRELGRRLGQVSRPAARARPSLIRTKYYLPIMRHYKENTPSLPPLRFRPPRPLYTPPRACQPRPVRSTRPAAAGPGAARPGPFTPRRRRWTPAPVESHPGPARSSPSISRRPAPDPARDQGRRKLPP